MTAEVFESAATEWGDDALGIRNTLAVEPREHWVDDRKTALVHVDTNYKPGRTSDYPVGLTLVDAVKAAAAFLRVVRTGYDQGDGDPQLAWELMLGLLTLDGDLQHLRELLVSDLDPSVKDEA